MHNISHVLTKSLEILVVLILSLMSVLVIVNVALRIIADTGIVVSEELSRFLFIWVVFLGSILAMKEDGHIYVDFIRKAFPAPLRTVVKFFSYGAMLYCCYLLCIGSYELYEFNMEDLSPVAQIPMGYIYLSGAVGAVGMGLILVFKLVALGNQLVHKRWE